MAKKKTKSRRKRAPTSLKTTKLRTVGVRGIHCSSCIASLTKALTNQKGVKDVHIDYPKELAKISYDPDKITTTDIENTIESAGFGTFSRRNAYSTLSIVGINRGTSLMKVRKALTAVAGIKNSRINLATERMEVEYDKNQTDLSEISNAVSTSGYKTVLPTTELELQIEEMETPESANSIDTAIKSLRGVDEVTVDFSSQSAKVKYDSSKITAADIKATITGTGLVPVTRTAGDTFEEKEMKSRKKEASRFKSKFLIGFLLSILIFLGSSPITSVYMPFFLTEFLILLILTLPVLFVAGSQFFQGSLSDLKLGVIGTNLPIALALTVGLLYSVLSWAVPFELRALGLTPESYLPTISVIVTLLALGQYIERSVKYGINGTASKIRNRIPHSAKVIRDDDEIEIPTDELRIGDIVIVKPEESVPTDGEIVEGFSSIDESMITGRSIPVNKVVGDTVLGSTINKTASFKFRVTKLGKENVVSEILESLVRAQHTRAELNPSAMKMAKLIIPVTIVIAILSLILWFVIGPTPSFSIGIAHFVSVLVIAVPCILGYSAAISTLRGVSMGAEHGILIGNASLFDRINKVDTVVLTKAGTLTSGKPQVTDIITTRYFNNERLIFYAASAEKHSDHKLAKAIMASAGSKKVKLSEPIEYQEVSGLGMIANINKKAVSVGNMELMEKLDIPLGKLEEEAERLSKEGKTSLFVAVGNRAAGLIAINDPIKGNAKEIINKLKKMKLKTVIVTGDSAVTAKALKKQLGMDDIISGVGPKKRSKAIKKLQDSGHVVAAVGHGITNAKMLELADVGISIGPKKELAARASDITLVSSNLAGVPDALGLAKHAKSTIDLNGKWFIGYNVVAVLVAAGVLFPLTYFVFQPMLAAALAAASTAFVSWNSQKI